MVECHHSGPWGVSWVHKPGAIWGEDRQELGASPVVRVCRQWTIYRMSSANRGPKTLGTQLLPGATSGHRDLCDLDKVLCQLRNRAVYPTGDCKEARKCCQWSYILQISKILCEFHSDEEGDMLTQMWPVEGLTEPTLTTQPQVGRSKTLCKHYTGD